MQKNRGPPCERRAAYHSEAVEIHAGLGEIICGIAADGHPVFIEPAQAGFIKTGVAVPIQQGEGTLFQVHHPQAGNAQPVGLAAVAGKQNLGAGGVGDKGGRVPLGFIAH